jgi:hypothetical protein
MPNAFAPFAKVDPLVNSYAESSLLHGEFDGLLMRYVNFAKALRLAIDEEKSDRKARDHPCQ